MLQCREINNKHVNNLFQISVMKEMKPSVGERMSDQGMCEGHSS